MPKIIHQKDPASISKNDVYEIPTNKKVIDWLFETFESQDKLCGKLAVSFILNGREIYANDNEKYTEQCLDFYMGDIDSLVIVNRPSGALEIISIVVAVISVAVSVLTFMNMPTLPGAENQRNESSNNKLNAATNEFRPNMGIPELFGEGIAYPDFIQPSFYYYENNVKIQVGLFVASVGQLEISEVRVGDTDINNINQSSAIQYEPFETVSDEFLQIHQKGDNFDGQVLTPPDDGSLVQYNVEYELKVNDSDDSAIIRLHVDIAESLNLFGGDFIGTEGIIPQASPYPDLSAVGTYEILTIEEDPSDEEYVLLHIFSDTGWFGVPRGYYHDIEIGGSLFRVEDDVPTGYLVETPVLVPWVGWFDLPGSGTEWVLFHIQAPLGLRTAGGRTMTIYYTCQIEELDSSGDPTGNIWEENLVIKENSLDPQFLTVKLDFPDAPIAQYRARIKRDSDTYDDDGNASEQLKIESVVAVETYNSDRFGDVTVLAVRRKATSFSPDQSSQKINIDYIRKLPYYDRITGEYDLNNLQPTKTFADAAAYTLITSGHETVETVDLQQLYAISDGLSDERLGWFTFTFDDADLSKGERIESICNAARAFSFHDGQKWRFNRDELKPVRSALFSRRSLAGNNAKQTWQPQRDDDSDSVRVIYVDPDTNTEAYIERAFDLDTGEIINDEVGEVPYEIKLAGCSNQYQATNRAEMEIRRIAYQRRTVSDTGYRDVLEIDLLDRVGWVDINDAETFDGEILGVTGNVYDTSERFMPESGVSYFVFITDDEGYPSSTVECLPRSDTEFGFIANGLSGAYAATGNQQCGSRYIIADSNNLTASDFTIKSRTPQSDGTVQFELIEYVPKIFEMD